MLQELLLADREELLKLVLGFACLNPFHVASFFAILFSRPFVRAAENVVVLDRISVEVLLHERMILLSIMIFYRKCICFKAALLALRHHQVSPLRTIGLRSLVTRTFLLWSHWQVVPNFTIGIGIDSIITLTIGLKLSVFKVLLDSFEEVYIDNIVEAVFF